MPATMIERVAKALAGASNGAPTTWRLYADDARVAIAAMRKPTGNMLAAAPGGQGDAVWPAMIDAALAEEQR